MYELIRLTDKTAYVESPAKVGVLYTGENTVCFIDSGSDKDAGKKLRKHLDAGHLTLQAVYNTHSHADHVGGNRYLQEQTGCRIFASGIEQAFTVSPILEPAYLWGGYPPKSLRHKFLEAQESRCEPLTADVLPEGVTLLPLPGHFFDMVGFRTADDVVYLADSLCSRETLDKYGIPFLCDVGAYLSTLETVKGMQAAYFVPAHAAVTEDIAPLAQYNIDKTLETAEQIADFCREPISFDSLLQKLFVRYDLQMTAEQHALVGSTVRSYLAWLADGGRVEMLYEDNLLRFRRL